RSSWSIAILCSASCPGTGVSEDWKRRLHHEVRYGGARFCYPASEPNRERFSFRTICTPVEGGVRITGRKYFATRCEGAHYGWLPVLLDGDPSVEEGGLYNGVVRLDAEGVTLNHGWDNTGQRSTVAARHIRQRVHTGRASLEA